MNFYLKRLCLCAFAGTTLAYSSNVSNAAVVDFDVTSGDWNVGSNWDGGVVPDASSNDDPDIGGGANPATVTIQANQSGEGRDVFIGVGNNDVSEVILIGDPTPGSAATLSVTRTLRIGTGGNSTANAAIGTLTLGENASVNISNNNLIVGDRFGTGIINFEAGSRITGIRDFEFSNATATFTADQLNNSITRRILVARVNDTNNDTHLTLVGTINNVDGISISNGRLNNSSLTVLGTLNVDGNSDLRMVDGGNASEASQGTLILGDANTSGNYIVSSGNNDFFGRDFVNGSGTLIGWGNVSGLDQFRPDARIIASGAPSGGSAIADRTLDFSFDDMDGESFSVIQGDGTVAGYYAENRGRLVLDTLTGVTGDVTWGDTINDTTPDLVNSIYFDFDSSPTSGDLDVALLAEDHSSVADASSLLINAIGFFEIDFTGTFTSADLTFRYDALAASDESLLKVFTRSGTGDTWVEVSSSLDLGADLITAESLGSFSQFAIAEGLVPEPTSATLVVISMGALLSRRFRQATVI